MDRKVFYSWNKLEYMVIIMVRDLEDQLEEDKAWWTCAFCGEKNLGTLAKCSNCAGVRTVA